VTDAEFFSRHCYHSRGMRARGRCDMYPIGSTWRNLDEYQNHLVYRYASSLSP
jgi:hypothetical protein